MPVIVPAATLVWDQHRAPLDLVLDRVGGTPLGAPRQVSASASAPADPVVDWFAPGQFVDLTDDQALTRPAYERLASGIRLTGTATMTGPSALKTQTIREIRLPARAERERDVLAFPPWLVGVLQPVTAPVISVTSESWTLSTPAGGQQSLTGAQARRLADLSGDGFAVLATDQLAAFAF